MIGLIKSELLKLFTVRSTYVLIAIMVIVELIFSFWVNGYKVSPQSLQNPGFLADQILQAVQFTSIFGTLAVVLLMTHEYRYNTIMFTMTASNSRTKTLLAKIAAVTVFSLVFTFVAGALSPLLSMAGASLKGLEIAPQIVPTADIIWRALFYGWANSLFALMLAAIIRNQVGAIFAVFIIIGTVETLLALILKSNAKYLPLDALNSIVANQGTLSNERGALVFGVYLVLGWLLTWAIFLRRDAN